jgi:uncharacterized protein
MEARRINDTPGVLYHHVLRFDRGDEILGSLIKWVRDNAIRSGTFTGIGAISDAKIGWFDPETQEYQTLEINEPCEITSIVGNIAWFEDTPVAHTHITLSKSDYSVVGGHLMEATVSVTCEIWITETPLHVSRSVSDIGGLKLIDFKIK